MSGKDRHCKCNGGAEYWSKRPMSGTGISIRPGANKRTKQITHHIERQRADRQIRREVLEG
jgi:hypothetical protein